MITVEVNKIEEEIPKDIFHKGNIVVSDDGYVVIVSTESDSGYFSAQVLKSKNVMFPFGTHTKLFSKDKFTQFTGTITITSK